MAAGKLTKGRADHRSNRAQAWRRGMTGLAAALVLAIASVAPAAAAPQPNPALNSTDTMLKWINFYRAKPEPDVLPALVRTLSARQAFKDAETSGA